MFGNEYLWFSLLRSQWIWIERRRILHLNLFTMGQPRFCNCATCFILLKVSAPIRKVCHDISTVEKNFYIVVPGLPNHHIRTLAANISSEVCPVLYYLPFEEEYVSEICESRQYSSYLSTTSICSILDFGQEWSNFQCSHSKMLFCPQSQHENHIIAVGPRWCNFKVPQQKDYEKNSHIKKIIKTVWGMFSFSNHNIIVWRTWDISSWKFLCLIPLSCKKTLKIKFHPIVHWCIPIYVHRD